MLPLISPLDAYRQDLRRHLGRTDFGNADTAWLLVAHCLHRLTRIAQPDRAAAAVNCANALRDLAISLESGTDSETAMRRELERLSGAVGRIHEQEHANVVCQVVRTLADQMGEAGALTLAHSALGHVRVAAAAANGREQGLTLAAEAYVSRSLGDLDGADELYMLAGELGHRLSDVELEVRAALGKGVVARVRGNYPAARALFKKGLMLAADNGFRELAAIAHHGLLIAALAAKDVDTALEHGWAAFVGAGEDRTRQAEMLINLGEVSLHGGYVEAALRGFLAALARTDLMRLRLPALGGAVAVAARLGDAGLFARVASEIEESVDRSALPFENAQVLKTLACASAEIGERERAEAVRLRARALARAGGFFELVLATDQPFAASVGVAGSPRRALSKTSSKVIEALEQLDNDRPAGMLAAIS